MARPLRIQAPGLTYHITARGTGRMAIYRDDRDRRAFLRQLAHVVERHRLQCHAYCLMTTHYHLVATTTASNLSRAIQQLNGPYGQWWNRRHERVGHVFQGRFGAQVIQDEGYLLVACRYVVLNPVRAGLAAAPGDWPWSSYRATAGLAIRPSFLSLDLLWERLGDGTLGSAFERYRAFVDAADRGQPTLPAAPVLGDPDFVARFDPWRVRASREVPRDQRANRPSLESLFVGAVTRDTRKAQAVRAVAHGYSLAQVARFLALHPSTVSKMIAAATHGARP